jgi:hypothetical protein
MVSEPNTNFTILNRVPLHYVPKKLRPTKHFLDRALRIDAYDSLLSTEFLYAFLVDSGSPNGNEIHAININGLIYIFSNVTKKLITVLHPRKQQVLRYFEATSTFLTKQIQDLLDVLEQRNLEMLLNRI